MQKKLIPLIGSILFLTTTIIAQAKQPIPITFWHSMPGVLTKEVEHITTEFNASQNQYKIIPVYKGNYAETLTTTAAAFRAHQQPAIVQIFEVGTATMMFPKGIVVPTYQVMQKAGLKLNPNSFIPAIASYYSDERKRLQAMPFNSSTPVMFYNKDAFTKAGLNPNNPPKTWPEVKQTSEKLLKAGFNCGFTSAWPSWIQLEAFSAWHNLPFATQDNGFKSVNAHLQYNNAAVIHHIATLAKWQKQQIFVYGGREDDAQSLFTSGKCPILMESSGSRSGLQANTTFTVGIGSIPYWPNIKAAPQNMLIGGGALWVLTGFSDQIYRGIAEFFTFLAKPEIQAQWQQTTGYLPVTTAAYQLSQKQGFYQHNTGANVAIDELKNKKPTDNSKGIRLGNYSQIRMINDQALEAIWSGQISAKKGLNHAVKQGNLELQRFARNVG